MYFILRHFVVIIVLNMTCMKSEELEIPIKNDIEITDEQDEFLKEYLNLDKTPTELAKEMKGWGDHRSLATILRSIQRMASGDTSFSGEMRVIISMMLYQQELNERKYKNLIWEEHKNGTLSTMVDEFTLSLYPQTRGRWLISVVYKNGYSHPWPSWQTNINAAKRKGLMCLEDAKRQILESEQ